MKIFKIILLILCLYNVSVAQVKLKTEVVIDNSYGKKLAFLKACITEANNYLKPIDLSISVEAIDYKKVYRTNIDDALDSLKVSKGTTITMGVYSKDYDTGDKIGLSYIDVLDTELSKLVVNLDTTQSAKLNGSLIAHEICHILGLGHTKDKKNLMYFRTTDENVKLNVKQIKYLKDVINKRYSISSSSQRIIKI